MSAILVGALYPRNVIAYDDFDERPRLRPFCSNGAEIENEPQNASTPAEFDFYCLQGDSLFVARACPATRRTRPLQLLVAHPLDPESLRASPASLVVPALEGAVRTGASDDGRSVYVVATPPSILLVFRRDMRSGLLSADETMNFDNASARDAFFAKMTSKWGLNEAGQRGSP